MDDVTEMLPFTEKPGVLYVAPLGSDLPDLTVREGRFALTWPGSWVKVLPPGQLTDPALCEVERAAMPTEAVRVTDHFDLLASRQAWAWSFGNYVSVGLTKWLTPHTWSRASGIKMTEVRMMLGWESEDLTDRVIARQFYIDEDGWFQIEQAYAPTAVQPERRWWHWLMWWRRPLTVSGLYPPFEVWQVGELHQAV